jgi:hypothetical protein
MICVITRVMSISLSEQNQRCCEAGEGNYAQLSAWDVLDSQ